MFGELGKNLSVGATAGLEIQGNLKALSPINLMMQSNFAPQQLDSINRSKNYQIKLINTASLDALKRIDDESKRVRARRKRCRHYNCI